MGARSWAWLLVGWLILAAAPWAHTDGTLTMLDTVGAVGGHPAVAIGADGLALIAYHDLTNGQVKVAHCENVTCTSATLSTIDTTGAQEMQTAITMGTDGRGLITYAGDNRWLKAAHCNDAACTSATVSVVDPQIVEGRTGVAIGTDGLPLIVYVRRGVPLSTLVAAHCSNPACTSALRSELAPVTSFNGRGMDASIAIGVDGLGLIAYVPSSFNTDTIAMAHCLDVACSAVAPGRTPSPGHAPQGSPIVALPSLLIGPDGRGLVSYHRHFASSGGSDQIVIQHCASAGCAAFDSTRVIPHDGGGPNAPLALSPAGLPWFARFNGSRLRLAQCADASCSTFAESCLASVPGTDTSLARGADGAPLAAAFLPIPDADLAVVHGAGPCPPAVASVADVDSPEGNGPTLREIAISASPTPDEPFTVQVVTADGTAQAGSDYEAVSATLTFPPGNPSPQYALLPVLGDQQFENDETIQVTLSNPQGGIIGDGQGIVTLLNDDPPPELRVQDCFATEGDVGSSDCRLEVRRSGSPSSLPITVDFATADGTAQAGLDYTALSGTLTFAPGTAAQSITVSVTGDTTLELDETFAVTLTNAANAVILDGEATGWIVDDDAPSLSSVEVGHGTRLTADLAAAPGPLADQDLYRLAQGPYSSWEVVVDGVSGDVAPGLVLERLAEDNSTVLQTGTATGLGNARSLAWQHDRPIPEVRHHIRVRSASCTSDCGPDDAYRLRVHETTLSGARFNNVGQQVTVLLLQNTTDRPIETTAQFWDPDGMLLRSAPLPVPPRALLVLATFVYPEVAQRSGSLTITHDGPHGALVGKAVALEPPTGFSFDTPLETKPR